MSKNEDKIRPEVESYRKGIEDRATWFYLLLKAAKEEGAEEEKIAEKAVTQFGINKGKKLGEIEDAAAFARALFKGDGKGAFAMELVEESSDKSVLHFHYCPLVESWKKHGLEKDEIANLCRLARFGDLGMISNFPHLKLEFGELLSEGDDYCKLIVKKVNS